MTCSSLGLSIGRSNNSSLPQYRPKGQAAHGNRQHASLHVFGVGSEGVAESNEHVIDVHAKPAGKQAGWKCIRASSRWKLIGQLYKLHCTPSKSPASLEITVS